MKKVFALILVMVMFALAMTACSSKPAETTPTEAPAATEAPTDAPAEEPTDAPAEATDTPAEEPTDAPAA